MNALKPIVRLECLDGNVSVACIRTVRTHLYGTFEKLLSPPGENTIFGQNHSLLFINFISKNSDWLESTRTLFAMSCLTICKVLYEQQDQRFNWFCPNPCQLQTSCSLEHCVPRGIFTHQFRCRCPNGHVWNEKVFTCLPVKENARITNTWAPTKCEQLCYETGTLSCYSSGIDGEAICLCMPGFEGPSCNQWVGVWSQWSPWDKCRPQCGDLRYSVRSRDCQSMKSEAKKKFDCVGASIEYASCAPHPCARKNIISVQLDRTQFQIKSYYVDSRKEKAAISFMSEK
ncbi:hypothetical protein CRM22_010343 [Opisthorchis felineus]|uniref:EGF-like domain-containing protein n=1 Tax=Opisthorchis felineus TaxID=147828 RepID=A0A4S2L0J7_OPIFE|nr:hypothetical protein CRM22_010343 [Opisthorchis felineus]